MRVKELSSQPEERWGKTSEQVVNGALGTINILHERSAFEVVLNVIHFLFFGAETKLETTQPLISKGGSAQM